jgi:WD40 repeat protein
MMNNDNLSIPVRQFRGNGFMTVAKFNHSKTRLYIADKDSKIITSLFTNDFATIDKRFVGHNGVVWQLCLTSDDAIMCSCSGDMTVCVWDAETGTLLDKLKQIGIPKLINIFGETVATFNEPLGKSGQPTICFYELNRIAGTTTNTRNHVLPQKITTMNWLSENDMIYSTEDGELIKENLVNGKSEKSKPHEATIKSAVLDKNKLNILTGSVDGKAHLINIATLVIIKTFVSNSPICYATFLCNDKKIALGGGIEAMHVALTKAETNDLRTKIYNVDSTKMVLQMQSHFGPIRFIDCFGKICVTAGQDGSVKIHYIDGDKNNDITRMGETVVTFNKKDNLHPVSALAPLAPNLVALGGISVPINEIIQLAEENGLTIAKNTATVLEIAKSVHVSGTATTIELIKTDLPNLTKKEQLPVKPIVGLTPKPAKSDLFEPMPVDVIPEAQKSICVQNLPNDISRRELDEIFGAFGKLNENNGIKIISTTYGDTIAFVNYEYPESADKAVLAMHRAKFGNNIVNVDYSKTKKQD